MADHDIENKEPVVIFGDTSRFHLGSLENYVNFRKLVSEKYNILSEISYDFFFNLRKKQTDYDICREKLVQSKFWQDLESCSTIIVHGEGTTAKYKRSGIAYLFLSKVAKDLGKKCWLSNFSMFEIEGYAEHLPLFDYVACRDRITFDLVRAYNPNTALSFDCCILGRPAIAEFQHHPEGVALIRGSNQALFSPYMDLKDVHFYEFAWKWDIEKRFLPRLFKQTMRKLGFDIRDGIHLQTFHDYVDALARRKFSLTTSYHANIISYLAGIPFVSLDQDSNPKYKSTIEDLLPSRYLHMGPREILDRLQQDSGERKAIHEYYTDIFADLVARARSNVW